MNPEAMRQLLQIMQMYQPVVNENAGQRNMLTELERQKAAAGVNNPMYWLGQPDAARTRMGPMLGAWGSWQPQPQNQARQIMGGIVPRAEVSRPRGI